MSTVELDARIDALRAVDAIPGPALDAFRRFVLDAPEEALFRMSPLRWARDHHFPDQLAIDLFLHATHRGILEFAWGLLCPVCLAFLTTPGGLRLLQKKRCNFCQIDVECTIDDRVEVAFTVSPAVRRIRFHTPETLDLRRDAMRLHFSSSLTAGSRPHRAFADNLLHAGRALPGEREVMRLELEHELVALLAPASHGVLYLQAGGDEGPRSVSAELFDGGMIPDLIEVARGPVELTLINRMPDPMGYVVGPVEVSLWPAPTPSGWPLPHATTPFLTGARLIASQTFRDLFRAESLPSEGGLELKSVALLFTDLKGSTAIYERVGDLRAYDLVRRHFAALQEAAAGEGGAVVKTIGDAIMASFADAASAVRAAIRMTDAVQRLGEGDLVLKVGVHAGPCIAVDLNDRLDYFGRTVNLAARVQGIARPGEIVCTEVVHDAPGVPEIIAAAGLRGERCLAALRGIADEVPVVRLRGG